MPPTLRLAIVIPVLHDTAALRLCLQSLQEAEYRAAKACFAEVTLLVADGASSAETAAMAAQAGGKYLACPQQGRGPQMAHAATQASWDVCLLLHADTLLTPAHLTALANHCLEHPNALGGAFYRDFAWQYPRLSWATSFSRWWQRHWGIIYGDQCQFITRRGWEASGGFPALVLMEDIAWSDFLRKQAPRPLLLEPSIRSSVRRFQRMGWWRTKLRNLCYIAAWRFGVSAERIYAWYYPEHGGLRAVRRKA